MYVQTKFEFLKNEKASFGVRSWCSVIQRLSDCVQQIKYRFCIFNLWLWRNETNIYFQGKRQPWRWPTATGQGAAPRLPSAAPHGVPVLSAAFHRQLHTRFVLLLFITTVWNSIHVFITDGNCLFSCVNGRI